MPETRYWECRGSAITRPTRDTVRLDPDGYLFIEGRADDAIILGGENIAPAEIEDVLLAHPGITEAAVLGLPDPEWGQRLVAVVVGSGEPEEIRRQDRHDRGGDRPPDGCPSDRHRRSAPPRQAPRARCHPRRLPRRRTRGRPRDRPGGVDAVFDHLGIGAVAASWRLLAPGCGTI